MVDSEWKDSWVCGCGCGLEAEKGKHLLSLVDREGKILDSVSIEVRESEPSER